MDGVVVAGHSSERGHVLWRGHHHLVQEGAGGGIDVYLRATKGGRRHRGGGALLAATDRKALHHGAHHVRPIKQGQLHGNDPPASGLRDRGAAAGHVDAPAIGNRSQGHLQVDHVVEVHRVEQPLNHRVVPLNAPRTQGGVDRRPAGTHQHIRGDFCGVPARHTRVGAWQLRRQVEVVADHAVIIHRGQGGDLIASSGGRPHPGHPGQQVEHRLREAFIIHHRGGCLRHLQGNIHMTNVVGALLHRQVLPHRIGKDPQGELSGGIVADLKGFRGQVAGRVIDHMPMP